MHCGLKRRLRLAASIQQASEHPLARAVVGAAQSEGMTLSRVADVTAPLGRGIAATLDVRRLISVLHKGKKVQR
ncbi:MAG: P-type Cu+ transporter [Paraburkholderia sp.]|jgi:Cu+-exporting ATPase|nr:P-type Cu+ transporter [Paraburkholderia sp.]